MKARTDKVDRAIRKSKKNIKKHSRSGIYLAIIFVAFLASYMTWKGLLSLNRWYDSHRIVTHDIIRIQLHFPISIEKRDDKIISPLPKNMPSPTPTPKVIKHSFNYIPDQYEYVRSKVVAKAKEIWGDNENIDAIDFIITHESHYNPLAMNPSSGACGLGQALPCEKMGCQTLEDIDCQVNWTLKYIKDRYGSPIEAQRFWNLHEYY